MTDSQGRPEKACRIVAWGNEVYVRSPQATDMAEFLRIVDESRAFHEPWAYPPSTPDHFADYVARVDDPACAPLLLCKRTGNRVVGAVNLSNICYGNFCNACIGYWIGIHDRGQGLMKEGLSIVLQFAFRELNLHRIEANVQPGNESSRRLLVRIGFRFEGFSPGFLRIGGEWKDHERWAIRSDEYGEARGPISPDSHMPVT